MDEQFKEIDVPEIGLENRLGKVEVPEVSESIWSDPRLKDCQSWFQTAFYLLQEQQRHQEPDYTARQAQISDIDRFLDRLALLFARMKQQRGTTPKHVTAAGLVQDKTVWYVCITKNNGFDGVDEDFRRELEKWFALSASEDRHPNPENDLWQRLLTFWGDRIHYYTKCAKKIDWEKQIGHKKMSDCKSDVANHFYSVMPTFNQKAFDGEWAEVPKRLQQVKNIEWVEVPGTPEQVESKKRDKMPARRLPKMSNESQPYCMDFYDFWSRPQRQQYPPVRNPDSEDQLSPRESAANLYCKCVYYIDMLALPMSILKTMVLFRELKNQNTIRIILVEKPILTESGGQLNKSAVAQILEDWKREGTIDTSRALTTLKAGLEKTQSIYLHCELQMLMLFHQVEDQSNLIKHPFIGCSKLSCWLCWQILRERDYRTRGTHGTISANWDFPFPKSLDKMVDSFIALRSEWEFLFQANPNGQLPRGSRLLDTDPASTNRNTFDEKHTRTQLRNLDFQAYHFNGSDCPWQRFSKGPPKEGAFARVYPAYYKQLGVKPSGSIHLYALKEINIDSKWKLDGVLREIKIMRGLDHQNILVLREAFFEQTDARMAYLVTDPWAKQSLYDFFWELLKENKYEPWYQPGALEPWPSVVKKCLDGLEYLHARDIKHKDLKPQNILIYTVDAVHGNGEVRPIIADFNISEDNYVLQGRTKGAGTPEFKAPEQIENGEKTLLSDIWSLGCCFSLILLLLYAGKDKLHEIWRVILESQEVNDRGFRRDSNRKLVIDTLLAPGTHSDAPVMVVFVQELKSMLEKMLTVSYRDRPSACDARGFIGQLQYRLQVLELDLPSISICIEQGQTVKVVPIQILDLLPIGSLLKPHSEYIHRDLSRGTLGLNMTLISRQEVGYVAFLALPKLYDRTTSMWKGTWGFGFLTWFLAPMLLKPDEYLKADLGWEPVPRSSAWRHMSDWESSIDAFRWLAHMKQVLGTEHPDKIFGFGIVSPPVQMSII